MWLLCSDVFCVLLGRVSLAQVVQEQLPLLQISGTAPTITEESNNSISPPTTLEQSRTARPQVKKFARLNKASKML